MSRPREWPDRYRERAAEYAAAGRSQQWIARTLGIPRTTIQRWLLTDEQRARARRSGNSACAVCGASEQRLRNNGMCPTCTADRHAAIELMREHGATWREINEAFGITGARGMLLARERTR